MRYLIAACLFSISLFSFTQEDKIPFKQYGVQEGLPEEYVRSIIQDNQGFIWIGTQNGLIKFNGIEFKVHGPNRGISDYNSLKLRNISATIKGRDGKLWIGSVLGNSGLAVYDPTSSSFKNYLYHPDSSNIPFPAILPLVEDLHENIWFYSYSHDLDSGVTCRFDQKSSQFHSYPERQYSTRINDNLLNLSFAVNSKDSSIWLFNRKNDELKKFNYQTNSFESIMKSGDSIPGLDRKEKIYGISSYNGVLITGNYENIFLIDSENRIVLKSYNVKSDTTATVAFRYFFDFNGNIWYSSGSNLSRINLEDDQTTLYEYGKASFNNPNEVRDAENIFPLYQDSLSIYFIVSHPDEVLKQDSYAQYMHKLDSFIFFTNKFNVDGNPDINANFFPAGQKLIKDFSGTKWLGTRPNLYKEEVRKIQLYRAGKSENELPSDTIISIIEDNNNNIWISTLESGITKLNRATNDFKTYSSPVPNSYLNLIFVDDSGSIWCSIHALNEGHGICKFNPTTNSFVRFLNNEYVFNASLDGSRIWVSTSSGIFVIDLNGQIVSDYRDRIDVSFRAHQIFHDSKGNTWLGDRRNNQHGLIKINNQDSMTIIKRISNDETSLSSNEIYYIAEDNLNQIWIGTDEGFNKIRDDLITRVSIGSYSGWALDENNNFWTGTYSGSGLLKVNPESGALRAFGETDGLLHNDYNGDTEIIRDSYWNLYYPNYRGLSIFNPKTESFLNYTESHGFQKPGRYYCTFKSRSGEIWIGGLNGLNRIDPKILYKRNTIPPKIWITSMTIMNVEYSAPDGEIFTKAVDFSDKIDLSHKQKDLSFDFVALHYLRPEDNQYSWKLEGYDNDWTNPSLVRTATYTNLAPGTYTFRVKGSNADGIWNEEGDFIKIVIHPPIWLTTVAFVLYGFIFVAGVYGVHRFQKARTIRKERELIKDQQLTQAKEIEKAYRQLKETQSQLIYSEKMASLGELTAGIAHEIQNPLNFVNNFSELNKELLDDLKAAVAKNNQQEVLEIIKALAQNEGKITQHGKRAEEIVKSMLQHSRASTGEKELTDINALTDEYLRLAYHGLRAKDKSFNATFKAELDPHLPQIKVVPQEIGRVLLNLINNAFQAVKDVGKPEVVVKTSYSQSEGDTIVITISDNGPGIPGEIRDKIFQPFFTTKPTGQGTGLGLSMSYDIVTKGHAGSIEVASEGDRTTFFLTLPMHS